MNEDATSTVEKQNKAGSPSSLLEVFNLEVKKNGEGKVRFSPYSNNEIAPVYSKETQLAFVKKMLIAGAEPDFETLSRAMRQNLEAFDVLLTGVGKKTNPEQIKQRANMQDPDNGKSLLMYAVNYPQAVELLLERGANPTLKCNEGRTAMAYSEAWLAYNQKTLEQINNKSGRGKALASDILNLFESKSLIEKAVKRVGRFASARPAALVSEQTTQTGTPQPLAAQYLQ